MNNALPPLGVPPYQYYRSTTPSTLGMLSIVFGSLIAATSAFGLAAGKQLGSMMQHSGSQAEAYDRFISETHTVSMVQSSVFLIMSLALIYIGVGQRKYMHWALGATKKWAVVGLAFLVINLIMTLAVVSPAMDRFIADISHGLGTDIPMGGMMKVGSFMGVVLYAAFPIVLLSSFRKPQNVIAMDQPPAGVPTATVVKS
jgi:hypothetical protein